MFFFLKTESSLETCTSKTVKFFVSLNSDLDYFGSQPQKYLFYKICGQVFDLFVSQLVYPRLLIQFFIDWYWKYWSEWCVGSVFKVSRNNPNSTRDEKKINSFVQIILNIFLHVWRILFPYGYKKRQEDTNKIWVSKKLVSRETKKQFYLPSGLENNFITLKSKVIFTDGFTKPDSE